MGLYRKPLPVELQYNNLEETMERYRNSPEEFKEQLKIVYQAKLETLFEKKTLFYEALMETNNRIGKAGKLCGLPTSAYHDWVRYDEGYAALVGSLNDDILDMAQDALEGLIVEGNFQAIKFILETKGSNRGFLKKKVYKETNITTNNTQNNSMALAGGESAPLAITSYDFSEPDDAEVLEVSEAVYVGSKKTNKIKTKF